MLNAIHPLAWRICSPPDENELVELAACDDAGAVYADFFEPRVFYRKTPYFENRAVAWERAEMDRPGL